VSHNGGMTASVEADNPGGKRPLRPARPRRNCRPRDRLGRPLPYGATGVEVPPADLLRTPAQALCEAQRLFAAGLPFHAHEVFEDIWKASAGGERELWRGLAQLAVGVTHAARGNRRGAVSLLRRGADAIAPYAAGHPHGLDVAAVRQWADTAVQQVSQAGAVPGPPPLPCPAHDC
jgi:uncharacterized protein